MNDLDEIFDRHPALRDADPQFVQRALEDDALLDALLDEEPPPHGSAEQLRLDAMGDQLRAWMFARARERQDFEPPTGAWVAHADGWRAQRGGGRLVAGLGLAFGQVAQVLARIFGGGPEVVPQGCALHEAPIRLAVPFASRRLRLRTESVPWLGLQSDASDGAVSLRGLIVLQVADPDAARRLAGGSAHVCLAGGDAELCVPAELSCDGERLCVHVSHRMPGVDVVPLGQPSDGVCVRLLPAEPARAGFTAGRAVRGRGRIDPWAPT